MRVKGLFSYIKKHKLKFLVLFMLVFLSSAGFIYINLTNPTKINKVVSHALHKEAIVHKHFDDENLYKAVVDAYNEEYDTQISYTEDLTESQLSQIHILKSPGTNKDDSEKITSIRGISYLSNLIILDLSDNNITENTGLLNNTALTMLNLSNNGFRYIDLSNNTSLVTLNLSNNKLSSIDLSNNTALTTLNLSNNELDSIGLSNKTELTTLNLSNNKLHDIDLLKYEDLTTLNLSNNKLSSIDLSNNTALTTLNLSNNKLSSIDLSDNRALTTLNLSNNKLHDIDLPMDLKTLDLSNNQLTEFYCIGFHLIEVNLSNNILTKFYIANQTVLTTLNLSNNKLSSISLSSYTVLTTLDLSNNQLSGINLSNNTQLKSLKLKGNAFKISNYNIMKGNQVEFNEKIVFPKTITGKYQILDSGIAHYGNNVIRAIKPGKTTLVFKGADLYIKGIVNVWDINSSTYKIDKENKYIYTKTDTDSNTILSNLKADLRQGNVSSGRIVDNHLILYIDDTELAQYKVANISSNTYDLTKSNIRIGKDEEFNIDNITTLNCDKEYKDNKLYIKYGSTTLQEYSVGSRIQGDINDDDKIDISDVAKLLNHVVELDVMTDTEDLSVSDVNNDGRVDISDVTKLLNYVVGLITEL